MSQDYYGLLIDPTRLKITLAIAGRERITADEVCDILDGFSRTVIHDEIGILTETGVLLVDEEKAADESVIKILSLNKVELRKHMLPKAVSDYVP